MILDVSAHYSSRYLDEVDAFASSLFNDDRGKLEEIRTLSNQLRTTRDTYPGPPSGAQDQHTMSVSDPGTRKYSPIRHIVPPLKEELASSTVSMDSRSQRTEEQMRGSQRDTTHPVPDEASDRSSRYQYGVTDPNAPASLSGSICSLVRPCSDESIQELAEALLWDSGTLQGPLGQGPNGTSPSSSIMVVGSEVDEDDESLVSFDTCHFCKDPGDVVTVSLLPDPTKTRNFCKATHAQIAMKLRVLLGVTGDNVGASSNDVQAEPDWVAIILPPSPGSLTESCVFL